MTATGTKPMTLAAFKRRIAVGTKLLCVHNSYRPQLNGIAREVVKVQTIGFYWVTETDPKHSHTDYPKACDFTTIDEDTVEWKLWPDSEHTLRLRLLS